MSQPGAQITWLGHSTVLLELDGVRLLTDPVLRDRVGPLVRIAPAVEVQSLGRVDGVLISHMHADHLDVASLRLLPDQPPVVAPRGAAQWLLRQGVRDVHELSAGEETDLAGVRVRATPARHQRGRWPWGRVDPVGYLAGGPRPVYFPGDTDLFEDMAELSGRVEVALLPVAGWGPRLGPGHLDAERASRAAALVAPRIAIPIHWGTLARGWARRPADPAAPVREFAALMQRHAPEVEVRVLAPGERTEL